MTLKAIQTEYNGYLFRSRVEARWAVFFDTLDVKYEYEKEGYELPSGRYLPDFFLPKFYSNTEDLFVEIKGTEPTSSELKKVEELAMMTGMKTTIRVGDPFESQGFGSPGCSYESYNNLTIFGRDKHPDDGGFSVWGDSPYLFCVCPDCYKIGFEFSGRGHRVCCHDGKDGKQYTDDSPILMSAATKARQARFGEKSGGIT